MTTSTINRLGGFVIFVTFGALAAGFWGALSAGFPYVVGLCTADTNRDDTDCARDTDRLDRLIESMAPTFLQNGEGWVCLDEGDGPFDEVQPISNFKHWPTAREAIDHMGERADVQRTMPPEEHP